MADDKKTLISSFREEADPADAKTHVALGLAYLEMGLMTDAISDLERALAIDPANVEARAAMIEAKLALDAGGPPSERRRC